MFIPVKLNNTIFNIFQVILSMMLYLQVSSEHMSPPALCYHLMNFPYSILLFPFSPLSKRSQKALTILQTPDSIC